MAEQPAEQILLLEDDFAVTTSRVMIGSTTYKMSDIGHVRMEMYEPNRIIPDILTVSCTIAFIAGVTVLFSGNITGGLGLTVFGGLLAFVVYFIYKTAKRTYHLNISSEQYQFGTTIWTSQDRKVIERIVDTINNALEARKDTYL